MTMWDNNQLEPVLITYNRAANLQKTLESFLAADLQEMRLHILDNASTDDTAAVVADFQQKWPNLQYHRNIYNIGGNANILRAIELTSTPYHWVIGDDDEWFFQPKLIAELISVMTQGQADVIRLGWLVPDSSREQILPGHDLALSEKLFFASLSMISSTILKRTVVTSCLPQAYQNIANSYPQLIPFILAVEKNQLNVYSLSADILLHTPSQEPGYFFGDFEWHACWIRTARYFSNSALRKSFVAELMFYTMRDNRSKLIEFKNWLRAIMFYKSFNLRQTHYLLDMLSYGEGCRPRFFTFLVLDLIMPKKFLTVLRKTYFKLRGRPDKTITFDRSRL